MDWEKARKLIGIPRLSDSFAYVEALRRIVENPLDGRRQVALNWLSDPGINIIEENDAASEELQYLIGRYSNNQTLYEASDTDYYGHMMDIEDPRWFLELESLVTTNAPDSKVQAYVEAFLRIIQHESELLPSEAEKQEMFLAHLELIRRIADNFMPRLIASQRFHINEMLFTANGVLHQNELEELRNRLSFKEVEAFLCESRNDLAKIVELANKLELIGSTQADEGKAKALLEGVAKFSRWLELYPAVCAHLEAQDVTVGRNSQDNWPKFPWDIPLKIPGKIIARTDLLQILADVEVWGDIQQKRKLSDTIDSIGRKIAFEIQRYYSQAELLVALKSLSLVRDNWPEVLTFPNNWQDFDKLKIETLKATGTKISNDLNSILLFNQFDSTQRIAEALWDYQQSEELLVYRTEEVECFKRDLEMLKRFQAEIEACKEWSLASLLGKSFPNILDRLDTHQFKWAESSVLVATSNSISELKQQIDLLNQAKHLLANQHLAEAQELIAQSTLVQASQLQNETQIRLKELLIQEKIAKNQFSAIADNELSELSDEFRAEVQALQKGHLQVAGVKHQLHKLVKVEPEQLFLKQALQLRKEIAASSIKLTNQDRQLLTSVLHDLEREIQMRLWRSSDTLRAAISQYASMSLEKASFLQRQLREIFDVAEMLGQYFNLGDLILQLSYLKLGMEAVHTAFVKPGADSSETSGLLAKTDTDTTDIFAYVLAWVALLTKKDVTDRQRLDFYHRFHRKVFTIENGLGNYVSLIRNGDPTHITEEDLRLLRLYVPEETLLIELLAFHLEDKNPQALCQVLPNLQEPDYVLVRRLVENWTGETSKLTKIRSIWEFISIEVRQSLWRHYSPIVELEQDIRQKYSFENIVAILCQPDSSPFSIQDEITTYGIQDLIQSPVHQLLDNAMEVQRIVTGLNRADPWQDYKVIELNSAQERLDRLPIKLRKSRTWQYEIHARLRGVKALKGFEQPWSDYLDRINALADRAQPYYQENAWQDVLRFYQNIQKRTATLADGLDWGLRHANSSDTWQNLLRQWLATGDGRLNSDEINVEFTEPVKLNEKFIEITEQLANLKDLHNNLQKSYGLYAGSKVSDDGLFKSLDYIKPRSLFCHKLVTMLKAESVDAIGKAYSDYKGRINKDEISRG